jgi:YggT family protein
MNALIFIVNALLQVVLIVFLLRVLLPLARADSRNQLSQSVIRLTNPLVMPLRKILPPMGKVDTASVVALVLVQVVASTTLWLLGAYPLIGGAPQFVRLVLISLVVLVIHFYIFALLLFILLSWVAPGTYSPAAALLESLCEPLLRPIRRLIPPLAGIDFSALILIIALQALNIAIG